MTHVRPLLLALLFGTLGACSESPEDALISDIDEYVAVRNEQIAVLCDCYEQWLYGEQQVQYSSKAECRAGLGEILPSRRRCIDDAFKQDVAASQQWIDCILPLEREAASCYNDKAQCSNVNSIDPCVEDFNVGVQNCIDLPNSVVRDFDACF